MNKINLILLLLVLNSLICSIAKAQTYTIESFEGAKAKINLSETFRGRALAVAYSRDTIYLTDYVKIAKANILNGKFLLITYNSRGGTGLSVNNTVIFCIVRDKIHVAMIVDSYSAWFSPNPDNIQLTDITDTFSLHFKMFGTNIETFKLIASAYEAHRSKAHPDSNYQKKTELILGFDSVSNVFYSDKEKINRLFVFNDPITHQTHQQRINDTIHLIKTGRREYYYINGDWYKIGYNNNLFKDYYKNNR